MGGKGQMFWGGGVRGGFANEGFGCVGIRDIVGLTLVELGSDSAVLDIRT